MNARRPVLKDARRLGSVRSGIVVLCVLGAGLAFGSAPALAVAPEVGSESAAPVYGHSATLNAHVSPHGLTITLGDSISHHFEYGTTAAYGSVTPTESKEELKAYAEPGVSAQIVGLAPGTLYHFRVVATNTNGETSDGEDATFSTPPATTAPGASTSSGASVGAGSATLVGYVTPNGFATTYHFEYGTTEAYGSTAPTGELAEPAGETQVSSQVSALKPNTLYHFRVVATNTNGETTDGKDATFMTLQTVGEETASNIGSSGATLKTQINLSGPSGSYHFEYGTTAAYGSATAAESAGGGTETVSGQTKVSGLQPGTLYHFRAVVTNTSGETADGADQTFTTYPASIAGLPDGRVYERVTPEFPGDLIVQEPNLDNPEGEEYFGELSTRKTFRVAADGSALAYHGTASSEGGYGAGGSQGVQYLARRTAAGWTNSLIQPLTGHEAGYQFFSSDLSVGILESKAVLTAGAPSGEYNTMYARDLSGGGYESLFDTVPPHRTGFQEFGAYGYKGKDGPLYAGASSDMSHKLFEANDALDPEAEEAPPSAEQNDLYDSYGGRPYLVNILPDGKVAPGSTFGGANPYGCCEVESDFRNVISSDGSRVFWTDLQAHGLYMRVNDTRPQSPLNGEGRCTVPADACTVEIDASQGPGSSGGGRFWSATPDGSRVFFTDCNHLTAKYSAEPEGCGSGDLYEYDVKGGKLTDLTVDGNASDPKGANVQGVVGTSEDGSYIYFVASGVLASGAIAGAGQDNLYALHVGEAVKFVATLEGNDNGFSFYHSPPGDWQREVGMDTAQVSPDGRHLIYLDNYNVHKLYMYDFGAGAPYCISCSPIGAPEGKYAGATNFPVSFSVTYALRVMSSDGDRVFFDSENALVPQDTNGLNDVYEWERDGSGNCELEKGCLYLLSSGTGHTGSYFLDASESGNDVFMVTSAQLGSQRQGEALHIVDAHVGTPLAPPECTGSGCQGVPEAPPIFATPSSVTFEGVGNYAASSQSTAKPKPKPKKKQKHKRKRSKVKGKAKKAGARRAIRAAIRGKAGRS